MFMLVSRNTFRRRRVSAARVAVGTAAVLTVLAVGLSVGRTLLSATACSAGTAGTGTRVSAPHLSAPHLLLAVPTVAAETAQKPASDPYYAPLPQETGAAGLKLMLRRLQTTGRLMQVTAHPDDEDGGILTLESRGKGVSIVLMSLTRGEGGQNKLGSNLFDVLGVLRTLELLASDRYYGVEQRFSRVADFGYSKTPEETFQKWQGHDIALADMVRVIRKFRPDVLIARFSGTERDGHGHHQASAILTKEAFRAAGDPKRFPEQLKDGLEPWQPKKLYIGNVCGFGAMTCDAANYTLRLNTGANDAVLGTSYIQFAMKGLRHQLSQGSGSWTVEPGDRFTYYKLVDSVVDSPKDKDGHEQDFFDGIDTTLPGLASGLGEEEKKAPWLREGLERVASFLREASASAEKDTSSAARPLFLATRELRDLSLKIESSALNEPATRAVMAAVSEKTEQADRAVGLALNVSLAAKVLPPGKPAGGLPSEDKAMTMVSPRQKFDVVLTFHNGSNLRLLIAAATLRLPGAFREHYDYKGTRPLEPGQSASETFQFELPSQVPFTRPYWHRTDPEETVNTVDNKEFANLPFPPDALDVRASFGLSNEGEAALFGMPAEGVGKEQARNDVADLHVSATVPFLNADGTEQERPLAVVPTFSVKLEPGGQILPVEDGKDVTVRVGVSSNLDGAPAGTLRLQLPAGWKSIPDQLPVSLRARGDKRDFEFKIVPSNLKEGRTEVHTVLDAGGQAYTEGYTLVTREDLGAAFYYQPAVQHVSVVAVKVPKDRKVGYVMGAGDDIPTVLQQIGMNVTLIPAEKLATENLSEYQTIVLGIRAYDTQKDVISNNKRLLSFVEAGGRLVVQYNTVGYNAAAGDFNSGKFTPYPATLSRARVSVEGAPVKILDPANPIFHAPNEITQKDFDGWVQERGLYFMSQWDAKFTPLLESHDPGESEQKGGLLVAHYGKGTYIYTGYAFFRQLPAGVPGAVRLFVNLVSGE
jgi:LmbE family N-acetylglucosaminyl deacetylase